MNELKEHEVRIHIDRKPLVSPRVTTNAALYQLGQVAPGYELFLEVQGDKEDQSIPNNPTEIDLKQDQHFYSAQVTLNPGANLLAEELEDLLPEVDRDFLFDKGYQFIARRIGADVHVVIDGFPFPSAYNPRTAKLLIILPAGYPNANLDMFRTIPDVRLANGCWPQNADNRETYDGVSWQRWSRHFNSAWRQGIDNLRTFIASIKHELEKGI